MITTSWTIHFCSDHARPADWWKDGGIRYEENLHEKLVRESADRSLSSSQQEFNERAERWERETAIHSAPGETILHLDYLAIITKGRLNKKSIVPLILKRLQNSGADWFFALQSITGENPALHAKDFGSAFDAWCQWAAQSKIIKDKNEVLSD